MTPSESADVVKLLHPLDAGPAQHRVSKRRSDPYSGVRQKLADVRTALREASLLLVLGGLLLGLGTTSHLSPGSLAGGGGPVWVLFVALGVIFLVGGAVLVVPEALGTELVRSRAEPEPDSGLRSQPARSTEWDEEWETASDALAASQSTPSPAALEIGVRGSLPATMVVAVAARDGADPEPQRSAPELINRVPGVVPAPEWDESGSTPDQTREETLEPAVSQGREAGIGLATDEIERPVAGATLRDGRLTEKSLGHRRSRSSRRPTPDPPE